MAYKSVEELNAMGTDGVAREQLILEEKKIKDSLKDISKETEENIKVFYESEIGDVPIPKGKVPFNGILTTNVREGTRPEGKLFGIRNVAAIQKVLKIGPNTACVEVGETILINVAQWQQRNMNAPVILLDVDDKLHEYMIITDRDIKYIF